MQEPPLLNPYRARGLYHRWGLAPRPKMYLAYTISPMRALVNRFEGRRAKFLAFEILAFSRVIRYNRDMEFISRTAEDTLAVAERFAAKLQGGDIVLLYGEIGAGKTTFTKGIARAFGVKEVVTSPTFTIVKEYDGTHLRLYHMDMYRLSGDITELGLEDYLGRKDGVSVIEWCAISELPAKVYRVYLSYAEEGRRIRIED